MTRTIEIGVEELVSIAIMIELAKRASSGESDLLFDIDGVQLRVTREEADEILALFTIIPLGENVTAPAA